MSFPLSPVHLAHMYDMLRSLPPFDGWKLPDSDAIEFRTPARADVYGEFKAPNLIVVSVSMHSHLDTIIRTLAHEMIHLAQHIQGKDNKAQHNASYRRMAKRVTSLYGWDYKAF